MTRREIEIYKMAFRAGQAVSCESRDVYTSEQVEFEAVQSLESLEIKEEINEKNRIYFSSPELANKYLSPSSRSRNLLIDSKT